MGDSPSQFMLEPEGKGLDPDANVADRAFLLIKDKFKGCQAGKGHNQESVPKAQFPKTKNVASLWTKRPNQKNKQTAFSKIPVRKRPK